MQTKVKCHIFMDLGVLSFSLLCHSVMCKWVKKWHYSPRNWHSPSGTFAVRVLRRGSGVSASQLDECRFWQNKYTVFISWHTSLLQNSTVADMLQTSFNGNQSTSNWKFFYSVTVLIMLKIGLMNGQKLFQLMSVLKTVKLLIHIVNIQWWCCTKMCSEKSQSSECYNKSIQLEICMTC